MFTDYDIKALKKQYPLKKGQKNIVVNRDDLSSFFEVSANTIDTWLKGGMPCRSRGGNGKSYEFLIHDCFAWFRGWKDGEADAAKEKLSLISQMRLELLGSDANDDMVALSPVEQKRVYEAAEGYVKAALVKGTVVRSAEVTLMLEGVLSVVRNEVLSLPDILEREVGLSPDQAEATVKFSKGLVKSLYNNLNTSNLTIEVKSRKCSSK